ncbi:TauD/TfdA family dioxygenase [Oxalobacteraceae bacterium A2-2]
MQFAQWKKEHRVAVQPAPRAVTEQGRVDGCGAMPAVHRALVPGLDLATWYALHAERLEQDLVRHGALLFRGFDVHSEQAFKDFSSAAIRSQAEYVQGATPRTRLQSGVYTSTEFSAEHEIQLHNELSYVLQPPRKIAFCCLVAAREGGQTQIADVNAVYQRLDPAIVNEFRERGGWMLRRHFHPNFGPTVFKSFVADSVAQIQDYCAREQVEFSVLSDHHYATRQVRDAVQVHPDSGLPLWMNHAAFWHVDSLLPEVRAKLGEMFASDQFPYSTCYGDGTPIGAHTVAAIAAAYRQSEVLFDWRPGDVLLLDNWRVAHGRKPFAGERRVIVAMGA